MTEEEAQKLLVYLNNKYISYTQMNIKPVRCGHASSRLKRFSLPIWALKNKFYAIYYIVHEFTHCEGYHGHGDRFKDRECHILSEFGISIIHAKSYPKYLIFDGEIVHGKK